MAGKTWSLIGCLALAVALGALALHIPAESGAMKPSACDASWAPYLESVDAALSRGDVSAAEQAWHRAYLEALGSRCWKGFVAVGDAYLKIGNVAKGRRAAEAQARRLYLSALFRARNDRSVAGMLQVAEAFDALGDREVVEQVLAMAERLAGQLRDDQERGAVATFRERRAQRVQGQSSAGIDPLTLLFPDDVGGP